MRHILSLLQKSSSQRRRGSIFARSYLNTLDFRLRGNDEKHTVQDSCKIIILTSLLLVMSLLLLSGTSAVSDESPPAPKLKLQQTPAPAQDSLQTEDIRDIKGPVPLPDTNRFLVPVAAAIALLISAALLFFFLKRGRRPKPDVFLPDVIALAELDRARSLMEQPLAYAARISTILRQYIEARFQIHSTRQTTQEFFSRLKSGTTIAEVDIKNHGGDLQECMEQCDIAKFAHGTPNQASMIGMDQAIRTFIETTRQKQQTGA